MLTARSTSDSGTIKISAVAVAKTKEKVEWDVGEDMDNVHWSRRKKVPN